MGVYGDEQTITKHLLFDLNECSKKLGRLRWNSDHTREIRSPSLAQIGKSTEFHELILLCSEHSPSIVKPILQSALSRCTESERQHREFQVSKKREAEAQIGPDNHKQARLPQSRKDVFQPGSGQVPQLDEGKKCESRVSQKDLVSDGTPAVTESHDRDTIDGSNCVLPNSASGASEPSVPSETVEVCQSRENTEGEHCVPDMGQGCVSAPQMSQESSQIKITNSIVPTAYEMELGLVRGEKEIQKLVMDKCMNLSPSYRGTRRFNRENELQAMFDVCRKLQPRIVKAWLLRELESRLEVPGNRTEIPSTANMSNPSEILDALQCIKMTTINSKLHRAYGQMRLFESVQVVIKTGKTPIDYLGRGLSDHRTILEKAACRAAGNVSEKERRDRENHFNSEYDAGKKWLEVCDLFGGPGIVLIFVTTGIGNSFVAKDWTKFQRKCLETISEYLPSITGLVKLMGPKALEKYCRYGYLEQDDIDAISDFQASTPATPEPEDQYTEDEDEAYGVGT